MSTIIGGHGDDDMGDDVLEFDDDHVHLGGRLDDDAYKAVSDFLRESGHGMKHQNRFDDADADIYGKVDDDGTEHILVAPRDSLSGQMVADLCRDGSVVVQMDTRAVNVVADSKTDVSVADAYHHIEMDLSPEVREVIKAAVANIPADIKCTVTHVSFAAESGSSDAVMTLTGKSPSGTPVVIAANVSGLHSGQEIHIENAPVVMLTDESNSPDTTPHAAVKLGDTASTVFGSSHSDLIYGGSADDSSIDGGVGDDLVYGGMGGRTHLDGGVGDDLIAGRIGGKGDDTLTGGSGNDVLVMGGSITQGMEDFMDSHKAVADEIDANHNYEGLRDLTHGHTGDGNAAHQGDTAVFTDAGGADDLFNFHAGKDVLAIQKGINQTNITNFDSLKTHMSQVGGDVLVDLGAGNQVVIHDVKLADLHADSFKFI